MMAFFINWILNSTIFNKSCIIKIKLKYMQEKVWLTKWVGLLINGL